MKKYLFTFLAVAVLTISCSADDQKDSNVKTLKAVLSFDTDIAGPSGTALLFNVNNHEIVDFSVHRIYSEQYETYMFFIKDKYGEFILSALREPFKAIDGSRESTVAFYTHEIYLSGGARNMLFVIDLDGEPMIYSYKMVSFGLVDIELTKVFESEPLNEKRHYDEW